MKYKVIDDYDYKDEVIACCNTEKEVENAIKQRIDATDGECYIIVTMLDSFGYYRPLPLEKFWFINGKKGR